MASSMAKVVFLLLVFLMSYNVEATDQPRCLKTIQEIEQELSSIVPPIEGWYTNNYHNISRALFPGFKLPSLYAKVTIQFLNDTGNQTAKTISDEKPKKFTWSESCTFVYVENIGLTAISFFSLGTIWPQRRQSDLVVTVPPLCENASHNNKFKDDNEMWQYVLMMLQDIAIIPNISDPRVNTALCVVTGHEGDPEQGIHYQTVWYKSCWWKFGASIATSIFVYWMMYFWRKENWRANFCHDPKKWEFRSILLIILVFTLMSTALLITLVVSLINDDVDVITFSYVIAHTVVVFIFFVVDVIFNCVSSKCDSHCSISCSSFIKCLYPVCSISWSSFIKCLYTVCSIIRSSFIKYLYPVCSVCMFPCIYQIVHHLVWLMSGGISADPLWAVPLFLCECLAIFALVCAICVYQKEHVEDGKCKVACYLLLGVVSFWLIIGNVVMSFYGNSASVTVGTTGIIEIIAVSLLVWLIKKSEFDFFGLVDKEGTGTRNANNGNANNGNANNGNANNGNANNGNANNGNANNGNANNGNANNGNANNGNNDLQGSQQHPLLANESDTGV